MNKLTIALAGCALFAAGLTANAEGPNRVLVTNQIGQRTGFVTNRIDKVEFATVDGEVAADIELLETSAKMLKLNVERTLMCTGFKIDVIPETVYSTLTSPLQVISYLNYYSPTVYDEDFLPAELTGIDLSAGSEYRVVTVGIDPFGVDCDVRSAKFKIPAAAVVGNPDVEAVVTGTTKTSFTVKFTPNADVKEYYYVAGEKGVMEKQYNELGPMFGFTNFNEMIAGWGVKTTGPSTYTWENMAPNTEYEVLIAMKDKKGNFAEYKSIDAATDKVGGEGVSKVAVTFPKYELADWNGQMLPSQFVTYTPNEETWCYRFNIFTAADYAKYDEKELFDDLCSDPPMPMANWFWYEPFTTDYQINPNTEVVVITAGKNAKGEWGPVDVVRYTTPSQTSKSAAKVVSNRDTAPERLAPFTPGYLPRTAPKPTLRLR